MALSREVMEGYARQLLLAAREQRAIPPLTEAGELSIADAYGVQERLVQLMEDEVVGYKLGLTSRAKQEQMGVHEPIYGTLLQSHLLWAEGAHDPLAAERVREAKGSVLPLDRCIHPKAEPEIAVILKHDLVGPGLTEVDAKAAIGWLLPAIDVIDSRFAAFRFTLPDVIADNASTAFAALGSPVAFDQELDLRLMGGLLEQNGQVVATATGAAVLGNPLTALAWLANALAERGKGLRAGQVVLTGALTAAVPVAEGDRLTVALDRVGSTSLQVGVMADHADSAG